MATLTIKKMPDPLYARLKKRAAETRRSINGEAIVAIELALNLPARRDPAAVLADMQRARARMKAAPLSDELLAAAKAERRR